MTTSSSSNNRKRRGQRERHSHGHGNSGTTGGSSPSRSLPKYSDLGRQRFGRMYPCMVAFSIVATTDIPLADGGGDRDDTSSRSSSSSPPQTRTTAMTTTASSNKNRKRRGQRERHGHGHGRSGTTGGSSSRSLPKYSDLGRQRFGRMYPCMVAFSIMVYWTTVSVIPVYNKFFFQKSMYPYPIATAGIQLGVVSILLALLNTLQHFFLHQSLVVTGTGTTEQQNLTTLTTKKTLSTLSSTKNTTTKSSSSYDSLSSDNYDHDETEMLVHQQHQPSRVPVQQKSWIFGPHFWWKVKWCFPIGGLFGLKYGVTNLGLHLVPAPTHLLLQSTDLVWTVLSAWFINGEIVTPAEMLCLVGCVAGSVVLSWQIEELSSVAAPLYAICINLISPVFLGLCLATLRLACTELMRPDNRVGGTVSAVELTSIKLIVSSSVGLILACILEGGDENRPAWWIAFGELASSTRWGVLFGSILISVFQVNCTFLTYLTSAVALGLVGQVKIIPQWFVAAFTASRTSNFTMHPMNLVGAFLIMVSASGFAVVNWIGTMNSSCKNCECACDCDCSSNPMITADGDGDVEHGSRMKPGSCSCHGCHHDHEGDDDDNVTLDSDLPPSSQLSLVEQNKFSNTHCHNNETKPLLMLSGADEWGASYIRKGYSACGGDETAKIGGCACGDECGCEDCDPKVPLLTAPLGGLSSKNKAKSKSKKHQHQHQK
eukprot:CAMPEP_0113490518 /NCGR_PEP_ID=MMETSP0014_2-20120614/27088_1 /TAXON_ID=2857 /ORGANISM="Nitzschia sp." /LENGTH=711 /DNA_ID=CAMNT_0000384293 /DNA_START=22 /DNA_END=2157 /DNA_ORIENTATION=- /assembly_acc=CAM_ASM_000159